MQSKTKLLPLHFHSLKDRENIIRWLVNKEDKSEPYTNEIPDILKVTDRVKPTEAFLAAFNWDIKGFVLSLMP